jgi:hypothetical protein
MNEALLYGMIEDQQMERHDGTAAQTWNRVMSKYAFEFANPESTTFKDWHLPKRPFRASKS